MCRLEMVNVFHIGKSLTYAYLQRAITRLTVKLTSHSFIVYQNIVRLWNESMIAVCLSQPNIANKAA